MATEHHAKCVCQICTCTRHHCPQPQLNSPFDPTTTYTNDFHKHPIKTWILPKQKGAPQMTHYQNINSAYRDHYPVHPLSDTDKIKPKVKQQDLRVPWKGDSQYRTNFGPKKANREPLKNRNNYVPTNNKFQPGTTYKSDFSKKKLPTKTTKTQVVVEFPENYKFNGETTYFSEFPQHPLTTTKSFKPKQKVDPKGHHDLQTIYRQQYVEKPLIQKCPIYSLPKYSSSIKSPYSHYQFNSSLKKWVQI